MAARLGSVSQKLMVLAVALTAISGLAAGEGAAGSGTETLSPLQGPFQSMSGAELFARLLEHNRLRDAHLDRYSAVRTYRVANDKGKVYAQEVVRVDYRAPDHKRFHTESEEGSGLVRNMVLKRLIESESETTSGRAHHDSAIKPANYVFSLLGEEDVGPYHCFLVEATPKRKDKYLFEGRIWIDAQEYAIVRIAGRPAKSPSFWITHADFVRLYEKIGEFWLPAQDETFVRMRLSGKKILTIQHGGYAVNEDAGGRGHDLAAENNEATETR